MPNFRAVQDGFYDGQLILAGATFAAHDEFEPNWAVEVDDHDANAANSGDQESLSQVLKPALPELERADAPLAQFHPAIAQPETSKAIETDDALDAANSADDGVPVIRTAATTSTSDPAKAGPSRKRPQRKDADPVLATGTEPSDAEKAEAEAASHDEAEGQKTLEAEDKDDLI